MKHGLSKYEEAVIFATKKHAGQTRKDGTPYIVHPMRVSLYLLKEKKDIQYQIAGLFHDLLEDTDATEAEIAAYGEDVLEAVKLLSKNICPDKSLYFENILTNPMAKEIKNADRIDNLRDAYNSEDDEFMIKYYKESIKEFWGKFSKELDNEIERFAVFLEEKGLI